MNGNQVVLTSQGLVDLKKELEHLQNAKRPELVTRLAAARAQGDLSENSEYTAAKQDLSFIDGRIAELAQIIHEAKIISSHSTSKVNVGSKVTVQGNGKRHMYTIVGEWEADPIERKISHSSPLGSALIGKKVGEQVEVEAPAGKVSYKIVSIE